MTDEEISKLQEEALVRHAILDGLRVEYERVQRIRDVVATLADRAKDVWDQLANDYLRRACNSEKLDPLDLFMEAAKVRDAKAKWQRLEDIDNIWYGRMGNASRACTVERDIVQAALVRLADLEEGK